MKKFLAEFKEFAMKGNVIDMAIGVVIGGAFGKITTSLVNDIIMPLIGWALGDIDLSKLNIILREAVMDGETVVSEAITLGVGTLLTAILDFILVALVIFLLIKGMNKLRRKEEAAEEAAEEPAEPEPTKEELLLSEIRDLLKEKN